MSVAEGRAIIETQDEARTYKTPPPLPKDDASHQANGHVENGPVPEPRPEDSATTQAELLTRKAQQIDASEDEPPAKKARIDNRDEIGERTKGIALIKPEFRLSHPNGRSDSRVIDDDAAERADKAQSRDARDRPRKDKKKNRGQNKGRDFGSSQDEKGLCSTRSVCSEFSPKECQYGEKCKFEHDLRKYLKDWKRQDLETFDGKCPIFAAKGWCFVGWKCRYVGSHSVERELDDGRKELVLLGEPLATTTENDSDGKDIVNAQHFETRNALMKKQFPLPKSDVYTKWLADNMEDDKLENRALYRDAPLLPSEKRKVYFGPETPLLAPLTTQGNLPFRRLAVQLGAQLTYSEMAMGLPLVKGQKSEWALMRAHQTELSPPSFSSKGHIVQGYDNSKDLRFGAQIAGNQPWLAMKTTEILTSLCSHLRVVDLNCGCPIDLVCDQGAGSQLLDNPGRLEKILRGMNTVSGEVPISVKIRMGTKDSKPTATRLIDRLVYGTEQTQTVNDIPSGIAAITLHGRSKQQRYTKLANWQYIAECAALIKRHKIHGDSIADTVRETDPRNQANEGHVYFNGNGDCYSHIDYYNHLEHSGVDSVMIGRGALIKPWLFEEIQTGQYLDKSSKERLEHIEQFCRYGMEVWGSDEQGIGTTRRFLLEWLNFTHRYVPIGLLEHLPPNIQERAQPWKGRDDMETLMGSENYLDWIKIRYVEASSSGLLLEEEVPLTMSSEMFLGPAHKDFRFQPKHKSNSYEAEG